MPPQQATRNGSATAEVPRLGLDDGLDRLELHLHELHFVSVDTDAMKVCIVSLRADEQGITVAPGMAISVVQQTDGLSLTTITKP